MKRLIETEEDVTRLRLIAEGWIGTPYAPDGAVLGAGISCHRAPAVVLEEFGMALGEVPSRKGLIKAQIGGVMRDWLDAHPLFQRNESAPTPGDVIVSEIPYGHLGLVLDRGEVFHSWARDGAHIAKLDLGELQGRILGIWTPFK